MKSGCWRAIISLVTFRGAPRTIGRQSVSAKQLQWSHSLASRDHFQFRQWSKRKLNIMSLDENAYFPQKLRFLSALVLLASLRPPGKVQKSDPTGRPVRTKIKNWMLDVFAMTTIVFRMVILIWEYWSTYSFIFQQDLASCLDNFIWSKLTSKSATPLYFLRTIFSPFWLVDESYLAKGLYDPNGA